jgi:hypothetical protein
MPVPPSTIQSPPQTLAEILAQTLSAIPTAIPTAPLPGSAPAPVTIAVSVPVTITAPVSAPITVSVTITSPQQSPQQSSTYPPTLEEFIADIERRKSQPSRAYEDPNSLASYLSDTSQEDDPLTLVSARDMALATTGLFATCTPIIAWNYAFSDKEAFYTKRFAQV